jgi:hypothetical protein
MEVMKVMNARGRQAVSTPRQRPLSPVHLHHLYHLITSITGVCFGRLRVSTHLGMLPTRLIHPIRDIPHTATKYLDAIWN